MGKIIQKNKGNLFAQGIKLKEKPIKQNIILIVVAIIAVVVTIIVAI